MYKHYLTCPVYDGWRLDWVYGTIGDM